MNQQEFNELITDLYRDVEREELAEEELEMKKQSFEMINGGTNEKSLHEQMIFSERFLEELKKLTN